MLLKEMSIEGFSKEVASSSPAPGGGSVAALAGAQGFALVTMVCRLTIGREKFHAIEEELTVHLTQAEMRMARLLDLVDEDTQGFNAVMKALALPKMTEEEKTIRRGALEQATITAAQIPLETAQLCLEGLRKLPEFIVKANPNALSDMGVAGAMFKAGLDGALYNVEINAKALRPGEKQNELLQTSARLREESNTLMGQIQVQMANK